MADVFQNFMPHGHCYLWEPAILWLHVVSDIVICMAYYSIPVALIVFVKKRTDLAYHWVFLLFGIFIFACGTNHAMATVNVWQGYYFIEGVLKGLTALVSIVTAILLWPIIPKVLSLPSPAQLQAANNALASEIKERKLAQEALENLNQQLEFLVKERTQELENQVKNYKSAQKEIQAQAEKLSQSNRELEQYAYVVSHDLRSPMRNISSFTQLLAKRYGEQLDDKAHKYMDYILTGTEHMNSMVTDLLNYARISYEESETEQTDLNEIVEEAQSYLSEDIARQNARITKTHLPPLKIHRSDLVLVFQNLLSNALKFKLTDPLEIQISVTEKPDVWEFCISDNGIGFEPTQKDRIFQIFQRLHRKEEIPGTGIGLSTCKKVIEKHGGKIWADSQPGEGSQFYFTLPKNKGVTLDE